VNHFLTKADNVIKKIEAGSALIAGLITMLIMFLMVLDIVLRNLFNISLISVYEFVTYSFVGVVALGFAYVQGQKNNVIVEIATQSFPNLYKNILDLIGNIIGLAVTGIIVWQNTQATIFSFIQKEYGNGLIQIPLWPAKLVLTVGLLLLGIRLLYNIFFIIFNVKSDISGDGEAELENHI